MDRNHPASCVLSDFLTLRNQKITPSEAAPLGIIEFSELFLFLIYGCNRMGEDCEVDK